MTIGIHMNGVASYKAPAILETDKKLTLVYGLNGTGKSTLSNYLYNSSNPIFANCKKVGLDDASIYVYNASFVRENFYEKDSLKGIFTLSKENKEVEEKIAVAKDKLAKLVLAQDTVEKQIKETESKKASIRSNAEDAVWPIKTKFTGGDRVLAYCLANLQIKAKLFDHLSALPCPTEQPIRTTDELRADAEVLQDNSSVKLLAIPALSDFHLIDSKKNILASPIVGNEHSAVAGLINKLEHADWVAEGVEHMDTLHAAGDHTCPFCQQKTISDEVANSIRQYFDESFTTSIRSLERLLEEYSQHWNELERLQEEAEGHSLISKLQREKLSRDFSTLCSTIELNKNLIAQKLDHPSQTVTLRDTFELVSGINEALKQLNAQIESHNAKLDNRSSALTSLKKEFWEICRWNYSREIVEYYAAMALLEKDLLLQKASLQEILKEKRDYQADISVQQLKIINVEHAVGEINNRLLQMGIDSFKIEKFGENSYRLLRTAEGIPTFQTLSEGEKTVISFLYFMELCKGQTDPGAVLQRKILVIDDPISSLSHLYVFNIGRAIRDELCRSPAFEKIIVLTHSLYFFYELTDTNNDRRKDTQKLVRLIKGADGARFEKMSYESIQNDYHAYWSIIKDQSASPALIANCMRNVIEYFFGFVKKESLGNLFQKLNEPHHQAFYRYVNRESHSIGQNIYDFKEFDYDQFRESLRCVFYQQGFKEHYDSMMA